MAVLMLAQPDKANASTPQPLDVYWLNQFGTPQRDSASAVDIDSLGNVITVGDTGGSLGTSNAGNSDLFITKHNSSGELLWTHQYGGPNIELGLDVTTNGKDDIYFASTTGTSTEPFEIDALLGKLDSGGNLLWTNTFVTEFADRGRALTADHKGDVYLTGNTGEIINDSFSDTDVFLNKYDGTNGSLLWSTSISTPSDESTNDADVDASGNIYIGGSTDGVLEQSAGMQDAFISKFDSEGNFLWTRQFGTTAREYITGIDVDQYGNVIFSGTTLGSLFGELQGRLDAFVGMYNPDGQLLWANQFGTGLSDQAFDVASDDLGNIFATYSTDVGPAPTPNIGNRDIFVSSFDSEGNLVNTQQLGSVLYEQGNGLATDSKGDVVVVGTTLGDFGGPNAGSSDVFIVKLRQVPEPSNFVLMATIVGAVLCCSGRCNRV